MHGPEHHVEHAEHASHAAHDPFDRNVTMSIAIVAAVLACVTMLSHRAHNDTLRFQAEANRLQTEAASIRTEANRIQTEAGQYQVDVGRIQVEAGRIETDANRLQTLANIAHTKESDAWNFYQAKNIRKYEFEAFLATMKVMVKEKGTEEISKQAMDSWAKQIAKYKQELPLMMKEAEALQAAAKKYSEEGLKVLQGVEAKRQEAEAKLKEMEKTKEKAREKLAEMEKVLKDSKKEEEKSHEAHARGDRYDLAELGVEMALVLCSLAVLTKRRAFWLTGMAIGSIGAAIALMTFLGLFLPSHH
jgi:chromosome segregation ATPase